MTQNLDRITRNISAFASFAELVQDCSCTSYRPTIREETPDHKLLADAFDAAMRRNSVTMQWDGTNAYKQAYRGNGETVVAVEFGADEFPEYIHADICFCRECRG